MSAVPAFAHASLVGTNPSDGAVIERPPELLTLRFSEPVSPLLLNLIKPDRTSLNLADFEVTDRSLRIFFPSSPIDGTYVLSWRVVSSDGHPIGGSVVFSVGIPSTASMPNFEDSGRSVRISIWIGKVVMYLALFLGAGGAFAISWITRGDPSGRIPVVMLAAFGIAGCGLSAGSQGLDALGAPMFRVLEADTWHAAMNTAFGPTIIIAVIVLAMALGSVLSIGLQARVLSLAALISVGIALSQSGHAASAEPRWLMRSMVFTHGVGIAYWTGALMPLGLVLARRRPEAANALLRFSRTIPYLVAAILVSGIVMASVQLEQLAALVNTAYGRVLLVKLSLLTALFGLAILNRWKLTVPPATRQLVRSIAAETLVVVLIFAVAAVWRFTPPPRTLSMAAADIAMVHVHTGTAMADVTVSPGHAGQVSVSIALAAGPVEPRQVELVATHSEAGIGPMRRRARRCQDQWCVDGLVLPVPGIWVVQVEVLISDFELEKLEGSIEITP
ncbi:copper resistance protein CopC [Aminobacter sp. MDW-2]|nr:copper resistance protein CopC [Aminobacter sp. MDW-2]QNH37333.1 copper resistance protein CopC [Aminobacter sp. MDW-2]